MKYLESDGSSQIKKWDPEAVGWFDWEGRHGREHQSKKDWRSIGIKVQAERKKPMILHLEW